MGPAIRLAAVFGIALAIPAADLRLNLRTRVEAFRGSGEWTEVRVERRFPVKQTALLICDMWDKHWCRGASQRVDVLAPKAAPLVDEARAKGIFVIHAPSDTMEFYKDAPQRAAVLALPRPVLRAGLDLADPPLPIDDSTGGCDTPDKFFKAWTRQHPAIHIGEGDLISDNGLDIHTAMKLRGIRSLLVMGVHTNMCILNRSFGIKQMTKWGVRCVLIRDLTDAMYNPADRPKVPHDQGTELVIQHIEKYWAPTILSTELISALRDAR